MKFFFVILFCISMVFPLGNTPWDFSAPNEVLMDSATSDLNDTWLPFELELEETELFLFQMPGFIPPLLPVDRQFVDSRQFCAEFAVDAQGCRPPPSLS